MNNIARWDPIEEQWNALGEGSDYVYGMGIGPDGHLYINGGIFEGSQLGALHRWDGEEWHGVIPVETGLNVARHAVAFWSTDTRLIVGFQLFFLEGGGSPEQALYWYEPETNRWGVYGGSDTNGMTDDVFAFAPGPNGTVYAGGLFRYAGTTEANHVAYWNGSSWEDLGGGVRRINDQYPRVTSLHRARSGLVYVGGVFDEVVQPDGTVLESHNVAAWDPATRTWRVLGKGTALYVEALTESADGNIYVGGYFTQVYQPGGEVLAVDRLAVWNVTTDQWEAAPEGHGFSAVFSLDTDDAGVLYASGIRVVDGWAHGRVMRLTPETDSWELLREWAEVRVNDMAVVGHPPHSGGVYVAMDLGGVYRWESGQWTQLGGIPLALSVALNGDPSNGGELFAGGQFDDFNHHIRRWDGSNWSNMGSGLIHNDFSPTFVYSLEVGPSETEGQAAVWAGGEFLYASGTPSVNIARWETVNHGPSSTEVPPSAQGVTLHVYPNPAADRLTVAYELGAATSARVVLYDLLGRELAVLHDGVLAAGNGTFTSDVKHLPSGIYVLRMTTDNGRHTSVQRVTVVR